MVSASTMVVSGMSPEAQALVFLGLAIVAWGVVVGLYIWFTTR